MAAHARSSVRRSGRVAAVRCGTVACLSLLLLAGFDGTAWAADGTPDTAFSAHLGTGFNYRVSELAIQPDGKIVAGGNFTSVNGVTSWGIARLGADGSPDTTFSANLGTGFNDRPTALVVQRDGKILVGGIFTTLNGIPIGRLARLNADGRPDSAFITNLGTGFNNWVNAVAVQGDGKILVGGGFTTLNGVPSPCVTRLDTDGTLDTTFHASSSINRAVGAVGIAVDAVVVQWDGRIVIGGVFVIGDPLHPISSYIGRLNADGSLDSTFRVNPKTVGLGGPSVEVLAVQGDDRIVFGGFGVPLRRLRADGTEDPTFELHGSDWYQVASVAFQEDGKILLASRGNKVVRLRSDGTTDTAFYAGQGTGFNDTVNAVAVQSDGKIVVGGNFFKVNGVVSPYIARLDGPALPAGGMPDTTFSNLDSGFNGSVRAIAVQWDHQIVVGGVFTSVNGIPSNRVARLGPDGTPDTTFSANLGTGFDGAVYAVAIQGNTQILVGGAFTAVNGIASHGIARLNGDGTPDAAFSANLGSGFDGDVYALAFQGDHTIVVGGVFTTVNGVASHRVAHLNADGTLDATFSASIGTGFDGDVHAVAVQGDGRILLGGSFTTLNGAPHALVARLQADGTPDATFSSPLGAGLQSAIDAVAVQGDGTIVVGGDLSLNGVAGNRVARLDASGTPDTTFAANLGDGFDGPVYAVARQWDDAIVVGGNFSALNGITSTSIARLHRDGTPDTTFTANLFGPGFNGAVYVATMQGDGKVVVGGAFTTLNGIASPHIARLGGPFAMPTVTAIFPTSGSITGGTVVTVSGANFVSGGTTVAIGGSLVTSVSVTGDTSLGATTPAGVPGPATVTVTTPGGSASLVNGFTYFVSLFTDDPLQPGITPPKAVHLTEVRQRIDALRARYSLAVMAWTDPVIVPGVTSPKAVHWAEARAALQVAYVAAGRAPPSYTDPTLVPGSTLISVAHLAEIRAAIAALW